MPTRLTGGQPGGRFTGVRRRANRISYWRPAGTLARMGAVIEFTRVTSAELTQAIAAGDEDAVAALVNERAKVDGEPDGYLDAAGDGLQSLFDAADLDIELVEPGDAIGEACVCFGWSAHLVANTAQQLRATPFKRLASHLDLAEMDEWDDDDLEYLREYYQTLVTFFDAAASSGSAAVMTVSY